MATLATRLAVFLQAGVSPGRAWRELAAEDHLPEALRVVAREIDERLDAGGRHAESVQEVCVSGSEAERVFSCLVSVADESGTPLSLALWAFADALRDRVSIEWDIRAITQAPRQTSWLLLALPPLSLVVAGALGINALGFLTGSTFGWTLLIAATLCYLFAMAWMSRLVRQLLPDTGFLSPAHDLLAVASQGGAMPEAAQERVERVLAQHDVTLPGPPGLGALTSLSRRVGIPIATLATVEARWQRHHVKAEAARAAQSLSVRILIPLGLLILPAFVMVGVIPVVITLLQGALEGGAGSIW